VRSRLAQNKPRNSVQEKTSPGRRRRVSGGKFGPWEGLGGGGGVALSLWWTSGHLWYLSLLQGQQQSCFVFCGTGVRTQDLHLEPLCQPCFYEVLLETGSRELLS
jgi:hypothetical protein